MLVADRLAFHRRGFALLTVFAKLLAAPVVGVAGLRYRLLSGDLKHVVAFPLPNYWYTQPPNLPLPPPPWPTRIRKDLPSVDPRKEASKASKISPKLRSKWVWFGGFVSPYFPSPPYFRFLTVRGLIFL